MSRHLLHLIVCLLGGLNALAEAGVGESGFFTVDARWKDFECADFSDALFARDRSADIPVGESRAERQHADKNVRAPIVGGNANEGARTFPSASRTISLKPADKNVGAPAARSAGISARESDLSQRQPADRNVGAPKNCAPQA